MIHSLILNLQEMVSNVETRCSLKCPLAWPEVWLINEGAKFNEDKEGVGKRLKCTWLYMVGFFLLL